MLLPKDSMESSSNKEQWPKENENAKNPKPIPEQLAALKWLKSQPRTPRTASSKTIAFQNLSVHGYTSPTSFQRTFSSYLLLLPIYIRHLFCPGSKTDTKVDIIRDASGIVHSGEMLLVLGRPGSGCTTFLKTIAGRGYGLVVREEALSYEGLSYVNFHRRHRNEALYVGELDVHFPELTLKQTLELAAKMRAPLDEKAGDVEGVARDVAAILHLDNSLNTRIGNDLIRGLSGGEKRRASIAEAMVSGAQIQCWDNTTRGLDSATALDVIKFLRQSATILDHTILVSVYQAAEEIYALFDKTLVLYEGYEIYFGPTKEAVAYFEGLGFVKKERATTPDFLTSITNPAERIVKRGSGKKVVGTPEDLANEWQKSKQCNVLGQQLGDFRSMHGVSDIAQQTNSTKPHKSPYTISFLRQIRACIHRAFQRLRNNLVAPISGIAGNTIVSIIFGSVFYNLPVETSSFQSRSFLIYYVTILNACTPAFEVLTMWAQRPIVEKHKAYAFSHPIAEAIASMIADVPNKVLTSLFANTCVYFMANLRREVGAFLTFWVFGLAVMLTMSMLFRSVGSLSRTYEETLAPVSMIIFNFQIYAGLVVPPRYMVSWLSWIRWINPIGYTFESLMINEFSGRDFPCSITALVPYGPRYDSVDPAARTCVAIGAVLGRDIVEGNSFLYEKYGYQPRSLWRNLGILLGLMLAFCAAHLASTEYMHGQKSKGDILLYRRKQQQKGNPIEDEESTGRWEGAATHSTSSGTGIIGKYGGLREQDSVFHWQKVTYDLKVGKETRRILDEIDGWVRPGTLTALMGVTGAGKTTLLDVLADRRSVGLITGDMMVDGVARGSEFQRKTGYVQQADLHLETATVREALKFSAMLRQSRSISVAEKLAYVDSVLSMLEMNSYADAVVGVPGKGEHTYL